MLTDPITLYKLMILYMLKKVKFPLTNAQMSDFFLGKEYTDYFTLQQALNELLDAGLIQAETIFHSTRYQNTTEGEDTLALFSSRISGGTMKEMDSYLKENGVRLREEVGVIADYYRLTGQDYTVHCEIREDNSILYEMNISVPTEKQAQFMCRRWKENNQEIYAFVMKSLMKETTESK